MKGLATIRYDLLKQGDMTLPAKDRDTIFYLRGPWENRATSEES